MSSPPFFVVVDFHAESRYLLVKTLRRKFPQARIQEGEDAESILETIRRKDLTAVITHRTFEVAGIDLVRRFREENADVPIVHVSGIDQEKATLAAGATAFLHYDQWLRIGTVVEPFVRAQSDRGEENEPPKLTCRQFARPA